MVGKWHIFRMGIDLICRQESRVLLSQHLWTPRQKLLQPPAVVYALTGLALVMPQFILAVPLLLQALSS